MSSALGTLPASGTASCASTKNWARGAKQQHFAACNTHLLAVPDWGRRASVVAVPTANPPASWPLAAVPIVPYFDFSRECPKLWAWCSHSARNATSWHSHAISQFLLNSNHRTMIHTEFVCFRVLSQVQSGHCQGSGSRQVRPREAIPRQQACHAAVQLAVSQHASFPCEWAHRPIHLHLEHFPSTPPRPAPCWEGLPPTCTRQTRCRWHHGR